MTYFNIPFVFNKTEIFSKIESYSLRNTSSYICVVDANMMAFVHQNVAGKIIVDNSLLNICDSSYIPFLIKLIHKKKYVHYTGCELFFKLLDDNYPSYYFLGSNKLILKGLSDFLQSKGYDSEKYIFEELPYCDVNNFDYIQIANEINKCSSKKIIFISLGAPKQEMFMYNLAPFLKNSLLIGVGAVFNYYSTTSEIKRAPVFFQNNKLEWLYRYLYEPRKQFLRDTNLIKHLPSILMSEIKKNKQC